MHILCAYKFFLIVFPQACHEYSSQHDDSVLSVFSSLLLNRFSKTSIPHTAKNLDFSNLPVKSNPSTGTSIPDTATNPFVYLEQRHYPYENHTIITEDGYILLAVRIPQGKIRSPNRKRPPVIFVHGIFCTFYDFLNAGTERAIGFQILEQGYDLWLLNTRGNTYSRKHVALDPVLNASDFWNFSWHEVGFYDVPATMDYIANTTGLSTVSIVGHSQGGTVYLALAASRPEYDRRITFSLQLAPVSYLKNAKQLIVHALKNNLDIFDALVKEYNLNEILPRNHIFTELANELCSSNSPLLEVCSIFLQILGGPSTQINTTLFPVLATNDPAGASVKQLRHYIQIAISDKFQFYDYGPKGNMIEYNHETPPLYNLSAITSPVAIYYGKSDYFISTLDGARLASQIPNALHFVLGRDTNHLDVQWGNKAVENVHRPAIKLLNKYNRMPNIL